MCARVRTPLAAPGLAREQRRVELCAAEQEERRRHERQGGGKDGARWGSDRSRSKLPFGSQSGVLPSPALIYCPSVPTEMRADDVLPGSHLSLLAPRRWVGALCRRGVASTADGSRRGRRRPAAGTGGPGGEGARATRGQWCSAGWVARQPVRVAGVGASGPRVCAARGRPLLPFAHSAAELLCSRRRRGSFLRRDW